MTSDNSVLNWQRTSPVAVVFFLLKIAKQFVNQGLPAIAVLLTAYASAGDAYQSWIETGLIVAVILGIVGSILSWLRFRYCIKGERVLVRSGVFQREELSVEFNRIQNIGIREPFYMRPFGLALLSIDTAGSGKKEIVLGGVRKEVAAKLRQTILSKAGVGVDIAQGQQPDEADTGILLSRSVKDIVIYGLTINFIFWFMIAMGAVFGAYDFSEKSSPGWPKIS
jgi:putative membrane protein